MQIDTSKPVLITGGTGYVAGRLIEHLLQAGLTVHVTVRDPGKADRLAHLHKLAAGKPGALVFFKADLLEPGSFAKAMAGCGVVFHVASPYTNNQVSDPQRELVDPALQGTRNVLAEVNRISSVARVVLTSSCVAIYGDNTDLNNVPSGVFTEEVWNTSSSLTYRPYFYSKTVAEKEAWAIHDRQSRWRLVALNPSGVFGPGVTMHADSESFHLIRQLGDGTLKAGAPDLGMGLVDVRDLAEAHLRAAFLPDARGRNIINGHNTGMLEIARILASRFSSFPIPRRKAPKWLLWAVGPLVNAAFSRRFISRNVGYPFRADNSKSRRELGMEYRPLEQTLIDHFQQFIDTGAFKKTD